MRICLFAIEGCPILQAGDEREMRARPSVRRRRLGLSRSRLVPLLCLLLGAAGPVAGQSAPTALPKNEQVGVWQPRDAGVQMPLWPASTPLAKPDSGDRPEGTGNGTALVGGRTWHWASYVTRPTMTLYRPKIRNNGTAMLVLPGGGFEVVAMDLEGTEICDWVVQQGMTCAVLKYRVPQLWPRENGKQQRPKVLLGLEDAQRAIGLLRQQAAAYGIDPHKIGVIGFSAGAYLAANIATPKTAPIRSWMPRIASRRGPISPSSPIPPGCSTTARAATASSSSPGSPSVPRHRPR
ncbi:alpha/beta hydrolase [Sphingomonas sp. TDK1]|uniref:alpha/beta hydrolase n=1 Tax=Sphingomonas sp. TDK1 TaxID=453247 RepID=UPI001E294E9B|nr:alpha/beta hydrolase [Sphingomonas sp. TDK1]